VYLNSPRFTVYFRNKFPGKTGPRLRSLSQYSAVYPTGAFRHLSVSTFTTGRTSSQFPQQPFRCDEVSRHVSCLET